jgi:alpha-L-fucosidase
MKQVSSQGLQWFQDARFGMFIHWGLYSLLARGEWVMFHEKIPVPEYEPLARQFNPVKFNADEWVSIAADAGQKYVVITSRHHDGFSMYDTALSDYKITHTLFKRDPLRELADACARRRDVKLGFYVSLLDWHHPAYRFRKETGKSWSEYNDFLHGQVRELCTNFGEIACIWFDGDWPRASLEGDREHFRPGGSFEYEKLYDMIHTLQPHAVVINNRHGEPLPGEDIQGFEQDLPGSNTAGFNTTTVSNLPLEVCMTINDSWAVNANDYSHKSARRLVHLLARSASVGANLLLNVGPTALGEILPVHVERLCQVGAWLNLYGESIYGTRAGIIPPTTNGSCVSTRKGDVHYIHSLDYVSDCIKLKSVPEHITRATLVRDGSPIKPERKGELTVLTLAPSQRDPINTVIKLELQERIHA